MSKKLYVLPGTHSNFESIADSQLTPQGKLYKKSLIRVGEWIHPADRSQKFEVTLDRMKEWIKNFEKGVVKVFVPERHTADPSKNRGWLKQMFIEGKELIGIVDITNPDAQKQIENGDIQDVSISVDPNFEDSHGVSYGEVMRHIALTLMPHIEGQSGFVALEGDNSYNLIFLEKENKGGNNMNFTPEEIAKLQFDFEQKKQESISLNKELETTKVKIVDLEKQIKDKETKIAEFETKKKELETKVLEFEKIQTQAREKAIDVKLENLITTGKVPPAHKEALKAILLQNATVKLEKGEVVISDTLLEIFGENKPVVDFEEHSKDDTKPPAAGKMTDEKAEKKADEFLKDRQKK